MGEASVSTTISGSVTSQQVMVQWFQKLKNGQSMGPTISYYINNEGHSSNVC